LVYIPRSEAQQNLRLLGRYLWTLFIVGVFKALNSKKCDVSEIESVSAFSQNTKEGGEE
jgi:hypothetical protein